MVTTSQYLFRVCSVLLTGEEDGAWRWTGEEREFEYVGYEVENQLEMDMVDEVMLEDINDNILSKTDSVILPFV